MIIKDIYHKFVIKLITNLNISYPSQTINLDVYKKSNSDDVLAETFSPTVVDDGFEFNVPFSSFNIGDELSKFVVRLGGEFNLYDLHEGISIVVDGVETKVKQVISGDIQYDENDYPVMIDLVRNPQFALVFDDNELHTVQAVYKGNKELGVAISDKLSIQALQRDENSSDLTPSGKYILEIINLPKTIKYMEQPNWTWRLTKGGIGVSDIGATDQTPTQIAQGGKTIELVLPDGLGDANSINSVRTNSDGYVTLKNRTLNVLKRWEVGKYKVGAKFYHYDEVEEGGKILTEVWQNLKIVKNNPKMSFRPASTKGNNARFGLKNPQNEGIPNAKLIIQVGSKKYIKTTDSKGIAYLTINRKGHFKYTVTYKGDKNLNKLTTKFEETIT